VLDTEHTSRGRQNTHCGRQSFFESATECSCRACGQLLQKGVILRALGCTELKRSQIHWKAVVHTVMKADCAIPYAALLLFLDAAAALSLVADQQWWVQRSDCYNMNYSVMLLLLCLLQQPIYIDGFCLKWPRIGSCVHIACSTGVLNTYELCLRY
jgi:hypothetical protein